MLAFVAVIALSSGLLIADSSADVSQTSNGYTYTAADARLAISGYQRLFTDHSFTLITEMAAANEMPPWDPVAHYVGPKRLPNGVLAYDLWLTAGIKAL